MITWVLTEEPDETVEQAIAMIEARLGNEAGVMWLCPGPVIEPVPE